jgi:hypothetical protein
VQKTRFANDELKITLDSATHAVYGQYIRQIILPIEIDSLGLLLEPILARESGQVAGFAADEVPDK